MSALDTLLDDLSRELQPLDARARSVLFRACGRALRPLYDLWLDETRTLGSSSCLDRAETVVEEYLRLGQLPQDAGTTLAELESRMPPGEAIGTVPSTGAQACWISYDTALRVIVEESFAAELCVEYVLEPITVSVSERLFGFSQAGSGPDEDAQLLAVVSDERMRRAVRWVREAAVAASSGDIIVSTDRPHPLIP